MVRLKKKSEVAPVRPAVRGKKKSLRDSENLPVVQQQTDRHTLGPYRGLNQSEIVIDWPWFRFSCACVYD